MSQTMSTKSPYYIDLFTKQLTLRYNLRKSMSRPDVRGAFAATKMDKDLTIASAAAATDKRRSPILKVDGNKDLQTIGKENHDNGVAAAEATAGVEVKKETPSDPSSNTAYFVQPEELEASDIVRLKNYALLELANLFSIHSLELSLMSVKKHKKIWERPTSTVDFSIKMFGVPLDILLARDRQMHNKAELKIPIFYGRLLRHLLIHSLDFEGVFRKCGSVVTLKQLEAQADSKDGAYMNFEEISVVDCVGLLKHFLKSLPEPLFTIKFSHVMEKLGNLPTEESKVLALQFILMLLPEENRNCIKAILIYFRAIIDHSETNRMNVAAITRLMWPNLCEFNEQISRDSLMADNVIECTDVLNRRWQTMEVLLKHLNKIWQIPFRMIETMCKDLTESSQEQANKKKKKDNSSVVELKRNLKFEGDSQSVNLSIGTFARVKAQRLSKSPEKFNISATTTAQMLVREFLERKKRHITTDANRSSSDQPATTKYLHILEQCGRLFVAIGSSMSHFCVQPNVFVQPLLTLASTGECEIKPCPDYHFIYRSYPLSSETSNYSIDYLTLNVPPETMP